MRGKGDIEMRMGRNLELFSAIAAVLWGLWVGNPFWDTFQTSTVFQLMAQLASEEFGAEVSFYLA